MINTFCEEIGEGKYTLNCVITLTDDGINIYIGGGEKHHIGTVVVSQPRPSLKDENKPSCTSSIFNLLGHKDDGIALPIAEAVCKMKCQQVVVTAGVHIDNATEEDINKLVRNSSGLKEKILECLSRS